MKLPRSRKSARGAVLAVDHLLTLGGAQEFEDYVPVCVAALLAINSMIHEETSGTSGPTFRGWWAGLGRDPRIRSMREIRNREFKGGEVTYANRHIGRPIRRGGTYRIIDEPVSPQWIGSLPHTRTYLRRRRVVRYPGGAGVVGTGVTARFIKPEYGGAELEGFLRAYLDWMTNEVLPEAERRIGV